MKVALAAFLALASLLFAAEKKRKPSPKPPELEVLAVSAHRSEGRITVDGRVRNISEKPIQNVTLVFDFLGAARQVITTQKGSIDEELLEPGKEAEFHWEIVDPVRAVEFRISAVDASTFQLRLDKSGPFPIE